MRISILLGLIFTSQLVFAQKNKISVFILAGQSNATGQGYIANLTPGQTAQSEVSIYHSGKPHLNGKGDANQWHPLMQASESVDRFGPELGLGYRLYQLIGGSRKIGIIKHAHSGTDLARQWNPGASARDSAQRGEQYQIWLQTVNHAIEDLKKQGYQPQIKAVFWQQGENDADNPNDANTYEANLKHLIYTMREDLGEKNLSFVLGLVLPPPSQGVGRDKVRQAQRNVSTLKNVYLVQTDDLSLRANDKNTPHPNDHLHFGTDGTWQLGVRMADVWFYNFKRK